MSTQSPPYQNINHPVTSPPWPNFTPNYSSTPYLNYPPSNTSSYPGSPPFPQQTPMNSPTGYPSTGGYANTGGNTNVGGYPSTGGYPNTGYPSAGGGEPGFNPDVCPTAPDMSQIEKIPGYEGTTLTEGILMPPTMPNWQPDVQERKPVQNLPGLSVEEVREAAIQFASEHCCYGSGVVRDMQITEIVMISAFHYKLETFAEKRESAWRFVPYNGQSIDGPMNGPAPAPWDVVALPPKEFSDSKAKIEVPHTAFVKPCHTCVGNGRVRCETCHGNGRRQCTWCKGRGRREQNDICTSCNGTGFDRCFHCSGSGQVKCKTCNSKGNLKGYVELTVTWTNHVDNYISETHQMPKELVQGVNGQTAYEEENYRVMPILHVAEQAVANASRDLVNKHNSAFTNERILKQRQVLRMIPIGEVRFQWKSTNGIFYVYGFERKVYFVDYPQKCCCCSIL